LYCFACHCRDCQRQTGSVFAAFASIEADRVISIGQIPPQAMTIARPSGLSKQVFACPKCKTIMWDASGAFSGAIISIKIGTLDIPSLMEPDMHMYVESKVSWLPLPKDAKVCRGMFKEREVWPKSSIARLEACQEKFEASRKDAAQDSTKKEEEEDGEDNQADKTPTAETPEEKAVDDQNADKEFERRQKALEERLEKLTLKISEQGRT
jgi:hypothetical protein